MGGRRRRRRRRIGIKTAENALIVRDASASCDLLALYRSCIALSFCCIINNQAHNNIDRNTNTIDIIMRLIVV